MKQSSALTLESACSKNRHTWGESWQLPEGFSQIVFCCALSLLCRSTLSRQTSSREVLNSALAYTHGANFSAEIFIQPRFSLLTPYTGHVQQHSDSSTETKATVRTHQNSQPSSRRRATEAFARSSYCESAALWASFLSLACQRRNCFWSLPLWYLPVKGFWAFCWQPQALLCLSTEGVQWFCSATPLVDPWCWVPVPVQHLSWGLICVCNINRHQSHIFACFCAYLYCTH